MLLSKDILKTQVVALE